MVEFVMRPRPRLLRRESPPPSIRTLSTVIVGTSLARDTAEPRTCAFPLVPSPYLSRHVRVLPRSSTLASVSLSPKGSSRPRVRPRSLFFFHVKRAHHDLRCLVKDRCQNWCFVPVALRAPRLFMERSKGFRAQNIGYVPQDVHQSRCFDVEPPRCSTRDRSRRERT